MSIIKVLLFILSNPFGGSVLDRIYLKMLREGVYFTNIGKHTAKFGSLTLWVSNHPYASFNIYGKGSDVLPSVFIRSLLMDRLMESIVRESLPKEVAKGLTNE